MSRNLLVATGIAVAVLLLLELAAVADALRYEREAVASGELWRLWTAHLVHLSASHTLLNVIGFIGVMLLVGERLRIQAWLLGMAFTAPAVSGALWLFKPELDWYVGLSGMLHGLIMAGSIVGLTHHFRLILNTDFGIIAVVALKIGWEQLGGAMPGTTEMSGGKVIVDAHLFGAVFGALWGSFQAASRLRWPSRTQ